MRQIHVIGAGLAGLSAAVRLVSENTRVTLHEAMAQAGGRCRSYFDTQTEMMIDNGNHLLLSGNHAALDYARLIGSADRLVGPKTAEFPFFDLANGRRWTLQLGNGRIPWWVGDAKRRVPDTGIADYLRFAPLLWAGADRSIGEQVRCSGVLYDRLVQPLLLAALNIDPPEGSAKLAGAIMRETLAAGGQACQPLIAREGLSHALVDPALAYLETRGAQIRYGSQLRGLEFADGRVSALDFGAERIALAQGDAVVLAVPPWSVRPLLPDVTVPSEFRAIVNGHFRFDPPPGFPPIVGVLNGVVDWIFAFEGRLGVTISAGDSLVNMPRQELAERVWREVATVARIGRGVGTDDLPPWQIVRERRATFAATPTEDAKRPDAKTKWINLALAGDWTQTGLPATIEGAIRSGQRAASLVADPSRL